MPSGLRKRCGTSPSPGCVSAWRIRSPFFFITEPPAEKVIRAKTICQRDNVPPYIIGGLPALRGRVFMLLAVGTLVCNIPMLDKPKRRPPPQSLALANRGQKALVVRQARSLPWRAPAARDGQGRS